MNTNTLLAIFAVLAAMALPGATAAHVIVPVDAAAGGVPGTRNPGQCQQDFNRNACNNAGPPNGNPND